RPVGLLSADYPDSRIMPMPRSIWSGQKACHYSLVCRDFTTLLVEIPTTICSILDFLLRICHILPGILFACVCEPSAKSPGREKKIRNTRVGEEEVVVGLGTYVASCLT